MGKSFEIYYLKQPVNLLLDGIAGEIALILQAI
jgi:hypothetical protein